MNTTRSIMLVIITALLTTLVVNSSAAHAVVTAVTSVFVVNSPAHPIPVVAQGTTAISGTVQVGNTAANPAVVNPVNAAPTHPFQVQLPLTATMVSFTVPAGQRLVIEYVNGYAGSCGTGSLTTTAGGSTVTYDLTGIYSGCESIFNQEVHIYADPGTTVTVTTTGLGGTLSLSGYLVPVQG